MACLEAKKSGDMSKLKDILEHSIGKPTQPVEQTNISTEPIKFEIIGNDKTS